MTTRIYLITNIDNNPQKVYIGKTINPNIRKNDHRRKFGYQINFSIIDEVKSNKRTDWKPLESYWIEQFITWGFELINKNKGGNGPCFQPLSMRKKISKINKGNKYNLGKKHSRESVELRMENMDWEEIGPKISKAKKGHPCFNDDWRNKLKKPHGPMSEETKQKLSLSQKGISKTKNKKAVVQLSEDGKFIKEWKSQTEAGLALGIKQGDISSVVHGKQQTAGGFKWLLKKDYE